jgi:hypothetical protein
VADELGAQARLADAGVTDDDDGAGGAIFDAALDGGAQLAQQALATMCGCGGPAVGGARRAGAVLARIGHATG